MGHEQNPLKAMETELGALRAQRNAIDQKISALEEAVKILRPIYGKAGGTTQVFGDFIDPQLGFTDAVRKAMSSGAPMMPTEVRDELANNGFDLAHYSNPLATIHTILKRLVEAGQAEEIESPEGKRYRLLGHVEQKISEAARRALPPPTSVQARQQSELKRSSLPKFPKYRRPEDK